MDTVINASPLIFLHKIDRINLLEKIFNTVYIPDAVINEVKVGNAAKAKKLLDCVPHEVITVSNRTAVLGLLGRLHVGEVEVIVGAIEKDIKLVVLDDSYARNKAKQLQLEVAGTLGILLRAQEMGFIDDIHYDIKRLKDAGMYISDKLLETIYS